MELQQLLNSRGELNGQKLIGLVHDKHGTFAQIGNILSCQIENSPGSADHNMNGVLQTKNIISEASTACRNHDIDAKVLAEHLANLGGLHGKLSCGDENQALNLVDLGIDALEGGDHKGSSLSGAVLCSGENVTTSKGDGNGLLLNG